MSGWLVKPYPLWWVDYAEATVLLVDEILGGFNPFISES